MEQQVEAELQRRLFAEKVKGVVALLMEDPAPYNTDKNSWAAGNTGFAHQVLGRSRSASPGKRDANEMTSAGGNGSRPQSSAGSPAKVLQTTVDLNSAVANPMTPGSRTLAGVK